MKKALWIIAALVLAAVAGWLAWGGAVRDLAAAEVLRFGGGSGAVFLGLAVLVLLGLALVAGRKFRPRRQRAREPLPEQEPAARSGTAERQGPQLAKLSDIEAHFLDLYRAQLGADPRAEASLEAVPDGSGPGRRYRLKVFYGGQWRERRMSISPLGLASKSKSQCFYVIFDTHLVVKIPPVPIRDFSDYLQRLQKEAQIADRLDSRPCIIPNLTAILSRVQRFGPQAQSDPQRIEAHYLKWLQADARRQRHLKIAGAFAFFMDLSRHQFLGQVLAHLADGAGRLADVVAEDIALIDDCPAFEHKYGPENGPLWFELQNLYTAFAAGLRQPLAAEAPDVVVTEMERKSWLLAGLAGVPERYEARVPESAAAVRDSLLGKMLPDHRELMDAYRRVVAAEGQRRALRQGGVRMTALAANVLDLLDWLGKHRVAMRDLKPDNLLVAGDPAQYPHFLSDPGRFVIGLIDVETAVSYPPTAGEPCPQPQLGGTPSYATPSHFFPNTVLSELYDDLGQVLQLQDWHAVMAIIFEIVTGSRLFGRTGQSFTGWVRTIRRKNDGPWMAQRNYRAFNRQFWKAARAEFDSQVAAADSRLQAVTLTVPEGLRTRLVAHLQGRITELADRIAAIVAAQDVVTDPQRRRELARNSLAALERLMTRCQEQKTPAARRMMAVIQELMPLKLAQTQHFFRFQALARPEPSLKVKTLLSVMFDVVATVMQPASWPAEILEAEPAAAGLPEAEEATVGFTHSAGP